MVLIVLYCVVLCVYEFGGGACFRLLVFDVYGVYWCLVVPRWWVGGRCRGCVLRVGFLVCCGLVDCVNCLVLGLVWFDWLL